MFPIIFQTTFLDWRATVNSNDVFILRYTWCLATPANKREFRLLLSTDLAQPTSPQQPYAAAISIWLRIPVENQQLLLSWMDERLEELGLGVQLPDSTSVSSVA